MSSPSRSELKRRTKDSKKLYCGDSETLPRGYWNFGTRSQCTRKGVGIGMYVIPKQKVKDKKIKNKEREKIKSKLRSKKRRTIDDLEEEEEMDEVDENSRLDDLEDKEVYKGFLDEHFDEVLNSSSNLQLGEIFKKLASLWKIEQTIAKNEYKNRSMERKRERRLLK